MCPSGHYASGIATRFSVKRGTDLGLSGLRMECSTPQLSSSVIVEDGSGESLTDLRRCQKGNFVSAIRMKYVPSDKFTGVLVGF